MSGAFFHNSTPPSLHGKYIFYQFKASGFVILNRIFRRAFFTMNLKVVKESSS